MSMSKMLTYLVTFISNWKSILYWITLKWKISSICEKTSISVHDRHTDWQPLMNNILRMYWSIQSDVILRGSYKISGTADGYNVTALFGLM